jgi:hypothetical protein
MVNYLKFFAGCMRILVAWMLDNWEFTVIVTESLNDYKAFKLSKGKRMPCFPY